MRRRFHNAAHRSSEIRALFVLILLNALYVWRTIPTLRLHQMVKPAAVLQIVVLVLAALTPEQFVFRFAGGNFIILAFLMLPLMLRPAEVKAHWVRPEE